MKKVLVYFSLFTFHFSFIYAQSYTISTFAGNGYNFVAGGGYSGDGGVATAAELFWPRQTTIDVSGNIYISEIENSRIRKVTTNGIILTVAGGGDSGLGDRGQATAAQLYQPNGVVVDDSGKIYIADLGNDRIRMVNTNGIITTIAGNGITGYSGNGGPATAAELQFPNSVTLDTSGNLYFGQYPCYIRMINTSGIISTFVGNGSAGYTGDGGAATSAELNQPVGVVMQRNGILYFCDLENNCVRMVNTNGIISTIAGTGESGYSGDGGIATAAEFYNPWGVAVDESGKVYIADWGNNRVRRIDTNGIINTIAGNGFDTNLGRIFHPDIIGWYSGDGGPATDAELNLPSGVTLDVSGNIYISDTQNNRIRKLTPTTVTRTNKLTMDNEQFIVYPNPNNGNFTLSFSNINENCNIEIYNVMGENTLTETLRSARGDNLINLGNKPNGVYFYRVLEEDGSLVGEGKIIIEK